MTLVPRDHLWKTVHHSSPRQLHGLRSLLHTLRCLFRCVPLGWPLTLSVPLVVMGHLGMTQCEPLLLEGEMVST